MNPLAGSVASDAGARGGGRRRFLFGVGVLLLVVVLQQVAQFITNRDAMRLGSVLSWFSVELPTLLLVLSQLFEFARRHRLRWGVFVALGMCEAAILGAFWGYVFYEVMLAYPELGLRAFANRPASMTRIVLYGLTQAQTHFGLWTLAFALPSMLEDARFRELEAQKLAAESQQLRSDAELARLRGHLEPHFLLNTLNAIAGLVTEDPRQARRLIAALGELLRDALKNEHDPQPLGEQLAWLKRYAQILEARHRGDLGFAWEIEPESEKLILPRLLLQPLVENAVKHGALRADGPGRVRIEIRVDEPAQQLVCTITDNGPGAPTGPVREGAFGLESVRRRLQLRYGDKARLSLTRADGETVAKVEIPVHAPPQPMAAPDVTSISPATREAS